MKLVYLIAGTFNAGGMERVMTNKANWLVRHGYEVTVITTDQRGRAPYFPLDPSIRTYDLGINYDETNRSSRVQEGQKVQEVLRRVEASFGRAQEFKGFLHKALNFPLKQWRHKRRLSKLLLQLKADVVICMFNNDVSFVYKLKDGSKKVLEVHFSKNKKLQYGRKGIWALADKWRTRQEERIVRHYDHFVVLTEEDKALWGDMPNITVIPNNGPAPLSGLSPDPAPVREGSRYLSKQVLAIGRLDYQKGFDRLIDIWARVIKMDNGQWTMDNAPYGNQCRLSIAGWQLDIVGDGPQHDELQEQITRLGLQDSIHLLPPTSDILSAYLRSSILVMTSRYEGLPMVLIEAQTYGLPIVAFACQCGPRDIITDGVDGYLIPDGDHDLFAERLRQLMESEGLRSRMGAQAHKASERFTEERIMKQWEGIFN